MHNVYIPLSITGTVNVVFTVVDFNDCPPEFVNPRTRVTVRENAIINSVLEIYSVRDCDSGLNGVNGTRFSIVTGETQIWGSQQSFMCDAVARQ